MLVSKLIPGISPTVCIFVRLGAYLPSRSEVSYFFGVLISFGISSSSSSSSSSVSVFVAFRSWTIFSFPFRKSRSIWCQRPYLPFWPRRQCLFFGLISPLALIAGSFLVLRSVWNNGPEIKFWFIFYPVSVFTELSVPLTAVCILFWNFPANDFLLYISSEKQNGYPTEFLFFGYFWLSFWFCTSVFVFAIIMWFVISSCASRPT